MFEGLSVAMVTPFRGGSVDWDAVDRLLDHLLDGGVDGIVPAGTTGESPTLTPEERSRLFSRVVERARGRAFVLAGTGSNHTAGVIETTRLARELGADGALVVTPYYNKPTQAGLIAHYERIAEECDLPIVLYNVPSRTGVSLSVETIRTLSRHPRIVAIKEACGSLDQVSQVCRDTDLTVLSGDDSLTLPKLAVGAKGVISVLGNLFPAAVQKMLQAFGRGDTAEARRIHLATFGLTRSLFLESNPGPVKHALARLGLIEETLRLPLVPVARETARVIDGELEKIPPDLRAALPESAR
jgi:4-hydroxy-tetrahydrodipicolinate synthase